MGRAIEISDIPNNFYLYLFTWFFPFAEGSRGKLPPGPSHKKSFAKSIKNCVSLLKKESFHSKQESFPLKKGFFPIKRGVVWEKFGALRVPKFCFHCQLFPPNAFSIDKN